MFSSEQGLVSVRISAVPQGGGPVPHEVHRVPTVSKQSTDDTVCVVREGCSKVIVFQLRDNKVGTDYCGVKDVERLKTYCEKDGIPYLDEPSRMMGKFDDGGKDFNTHETPPYVTLCVYSSNQNSAQSFAAEVGNKLNGTAHHKCAVDCDWPKYPDLIWIHIFTIRFADEPDWDAMPNRRFHLA